MRTIKAISNQRCRQLEGQVDIIIPFSESARISMVMARKGIIQTYMKLDTQISMFWADNIIKVPFSKINSIAAIQTNLKNPRIKEIHSWFRKIAKLNPSTKNSPKSVSKINSITSLKPKIPMRQLVNSKALTNLINFIDLLSLMQRMGIKTRHSSYFSLKPKGIITKLIVKVPELRCGNSTMALITHCRIFQPTWQMTHKFTEETHSRAEFLDKTWSPITKPEIYPSIWMNQLLDHTFLQKISTAKKTKSLIMSKWAKGLAT